MENYGEVGVLDFLKLMDDYLEERIDVNEYSKRIFDLTASRVNISDEEADRITQQAFGDADEYDPVVRLPYTILEPELRARVANSVKELVALGYKIRPEQ